MAAPKLEWRTFLEETTGNYLGAPGWSIGCRFNRNDHKTYFVSTNTKTGEINPHKSVDDAKAWCQAREDKAWAAHPAREFTDTEILDAMEKHGIRIALTGGDGSPYEAYCESIYDGPKAATQRQAICALILKIGEKPATPAELATEPKPDREMTLREFEEKCKKYDLNAILDYEDERPANVWLSGHTGTRLDIYDKTLSEALVKCLAAIEKHKAENPY